MNADWYHLHSLHSVQNELQYHYLDVRINSGDDRATSCKNLMNFCPVTPEMTAHLLTYVPVSCKIDLNTFISRAAIQKCHAVLECWWMY